MKTFIPVIAILVTLFALNVQAEDEIAYLTPEQKADQEKNWGILYDLAGPADTCYKSLHFEGQPVTQHLMTLQLECMRDLQRIALHKFSVLVGIEYHNKGLIKGIEYAEEQGCDL